VLYILYFDIFTYLFVEQHWPFEDIYLKEKVYISCMKITVLVDKWLMVSNLWITMVG